MKNHNNTPILLTDVPFYLDRIAGYCPPYGTVLRWSRKGRVGIKLASRDIEGRMSTTRASLAAFFSAPGHGSLANFFGQVARAVEEREYDGTVVERTMTRTPERSER